MSIRKGIWLGCALLLGTTAAATESITVAFGSCADDDKPNHPIWDAIYDVKPEIFLMLGDNVYADTSEFIRTRDPELIKAEYKKLAQSPKFKRLRQHSSVFATWDDHDYGLNDAGGEFAQKKISENLYNFLIRELKKASQNIKIKQNNKQFVLNRHEIEILKKISEWPKCLEISSVKLEPHRITFYLYELATLLHAYWNLGKDNKEFRFVPENGILNNPRLVLLQALSLVIKNGMSILGVSTPKSM